MLPYADVCCRAAAAVDTAHMLRYADVCCRMLTYADVCCRMLTYADVYCRAAAAVDTAHGAEVAHRILGTQFTCFTGTKVQTLTLAQS
jgi:hypothetical protein